MKICIVSSQIVGFGKIGGFGSMTKKIAESLVKEGHEVSVVVPRKKNQKAIEIINGVKIYGLKLSALFTYKSMFREIDADIYHSQNPNFFSYLAFRAEPTKKHVVTCRDPRDTRDWWIEFKNATFKRKIKTGLFYLFEDGPFISYVVRNADVVGCPAHFLKKKVTRMYGRKNVILLPNLEDIPDAIPTKATEPTVCFVGRLDLRKRPELAFDVAKDFPDVKFIFIGKADDDERQKKLDVITSKLNNVEMLGYVDKFNSDVISKVYAKSWILINTSAREGLPLTFIEAAGRACAILSYVNPDEFASKFGYWAEKNNFSEGLKILLENDAWRERGEAGFKYVSKTYSTKEATKQHLEIYKNLLS